MLVGLFIFKSLSVFSGPPQRKSHIVWCMGSWPLRDRNPSLWDETTQGLQVAESLWTQATKSPVWKQRILGTFCQTFVEISYSITVRKRPVEEVCVKVESTVVSQHFLSNSVVSLKLSEYQYTISLAKRYHSADNELAYNAFSSPK